MLSRILILHHVITLPNLINFITGNIAKCFLYILT